MPWKPEHDNTPDFANEIWSGIESVETLCARQQLRCSVLKASVFFQTFGAVTSIAQDSNLAWEAVGTLEPSARHAVATRPVGKESATLIGNHSVRKTQVSRDKRHRPLFLERRGHFGLPRAMVAHSLQSASLHTFSKS